ncbi:hypothetical protein TI05_02025 [Achromatium sp. WMS3]|nr:hypothetical protein TI05_02025 [Achromatium sp. WMS3]
MKNKSIYTKSILLSAMLLESALGIAASTSNWSFNLLPSVTYGSYSGSEQRDKFTDIGLMVSADYFGVGGLTLGVSNSKVIAQDNTNDFNDVDQYNYVISGRKYFNLGPTSGTMTLRLDGHRINNDDNVSNTDDVSVIASQVSWLSSDKLLYADLGYAHSKYKGNSAIHQFTPTISFGINNSYDWIRLRGYFIDGFDSTVTEGRSNTIALNGSWTHYFSPGHRLVPAHFTLGFSVGEKLTAVDMDALSVANLADVNRGAINLMLTWNVAKSTQLSVFAGQSFFRNLTTDDNYRLNVGYINLSINW